MVQYTHIERKVVYIVKVYHYCQFLEEVEVYTSAQEKIASLSSEVIGETIHFKERQSERQINLKKISLSKIQRGKIYEVKTEDGKIMTVGVKVSYNKKQTATLIFGFAKKNPQLVTAWLDIRR